MIHSKLGIASRHFYSCVFFVFFTLFACAFPAYADSPEQKLSEVLPLTAYPFDEQPMSLPLHPQLHVSRDYELSDFNQDLTILENSRRWLTQSIESVNDQLDVFFIERFWGENVDVDEASGSTGLIRLYTQYDIRQKTNNIGIGINLKLVLNNTNERLKFILTSQENEENNSGLLTNTGTENNLSTALRYVFRDNSYWKTSFDSGIRWGGGINPFTQFRVRYQQTLGQWQFRIMERFFWENKKGLGTDTQLSLTRPISYQYHFSTNTVGEYLLENQYWSLEHSFRVTHQYAADIAIRYTLGLSADEEHQWQVSNYFITYSWRKRIYKDFIFLKVRPGFDFPKKHGFTTQPSIYLSIEYLTY